MWVINSSINNKLAYHLMLFTFDMKYGSLTYFCFHVPVCFLWGFLFVCLFTFDLFVWFWSILPSFWKLFGCVQNSRLTVFSFSTLMMFYVFHCLLSLGWHCFLQEVCSLSYLWSSIHSGSFFFFWLLLRFFFIAGFKWFDYDIPWCSFLRVSCVWALLSFLYSICGFIMFIKCGKILAVASSNKFRPLYPFAPLLQELQSGTLKLSHSSLILCSPFSFIFLSVFYFRLFLLLCFQVH